jgi:CHAD domain-containing protein
MHVCLPAAAGPPADAAFTQLAGRAYRRPAGGIGGGAEMTTRGPSSVTRALPRVLRSSDDEAVHDLRVGIRRMRVLLKLARPVFGRFHADAVRAGYTVIHRSTGALRDAEVLDDTVTGLGLSDAQFATWISRRRALEARLRRGVVAGLEAGDLDRARARLHNVLRELGAHEVGGGSRVCQRRRARCPSAPHPRARFKRRETRGVYSIRRSRAGGGTGGRLEGALL